MFKVIPITERPIHNQTMVSVLPHFCNLLISHKILRENNSIIVCQIYVRAMTNYSPQQDPTIPCADAGMSFKKGDILEIVDQNDTLWWQAKKLPSGTACAGLIPSTSLLIRLVRTQLSTSSSS